MGEARQGSRGPVATATRPAAPRATYRLQFDPSFGFDDAAALAPYLAALGVSHVYLAPVFAARPGSTHGYDVVDPNAFNPELGGEGGFRAMAAVFRQHGLRIVLDIVPNHMGVGGATNAQWLDVLRWGPESRFARWFDIDWSPPDPRLAGKLLVPVLDRSYRAALTEGELALAFDADAGGFAVRAHGVHVLPLCPRTLPRVLTGDGFAAEVAMVAALATAAPEDPGWEALAVRLAARAPEMRAAAAALNGRPGEAGTWAALDAVVAAQVWRPAKFSAAGSAINYRRFFTISELAGVRVEDPEVFDATHALILALVEEGLVEGLRVDHVDGLRDPKGYLRRLRRRAPKLGWLLVEKIVGPDETLPADWGADGTTGYEFANLLSGLLTDPAGKAELALAYAQFTGRDAAPETVVYAAKREVMTREMAAELDALTARLVILAPLDLGRGALRDVLLETVAALEVYRTYADEGGMRTEDQARIAAAVATATERRPDLDPAAFAFLSDVLTLRNCSEGVLEVVLRFQQFSGPVMAKGLEDTALYRHNALLAMNEVGSRPGSPAVSVADFHAANAARLAATPRAMLATSTHDTKRGKDSRARIAALAQHAGAWSARVGEWHALLARADRPIDRDDEWVLYQLLLGAWPNAWREGDAITAAALGAFANRVEGAMLKSAREAGQNTRWSFGDEEYEGRIRGFVARALEPGGRFLDAFRAIEATIARDGADISLVQTVLKLTVPGVPDIYCGAEFWEQSLVDPDNRRPVDFARRAALLERSPEAGAPLTDPACKLAIVRTLLGLRRAEPALFAEGSYEPLSVAGPGADRVCAFVRRHGAAALAVAVALPGARRQQGEGTRLALPGGEWRDVLGERAGGLFGRLPVRVLFSRQDAGQLAGPDQRSPAM